MPQKTANEILADFFREQQEEIQKTKRPVKKNSKPDATQIAELDAGIRREQHTRSFITAARKGRLSEVIRLFNLGVDVDAVSRTGLTALMLASMNLHIEVVEFLLTHAHADPNVRNSCGNTALGFAHGNLLRIMKCYSRKDIEYDAIMDLLKQHGAR